MTNKCAIAQVFGANANPMYAAAGQKGHTGVDEHCGYGSEIYALKRGWVYKILDKDHPANDGSGYWGVFIIAQESDGTFSEWQVGHCSKIFCAVGDPVEPWTLIAEEGNRGGVYEGNVQITKVMQDAGDHRGSHRHWNKKPLRRQTEVQRDAEGGMHLTNWGPSGQVYEDKQGFVYQVLNYKNGYNGSVDPMKDIDDGYAAINNRGQELTTEESKVVEDGIRVAGEALKTPSKWEAALGLLRTLSEYLKAKLK